MRFPLEGTGLAKAEIIAVGKKLWQRAYVDGNGGNISCRLAENAVLCTPTLVSKADLTAEDLCLVQMDGTQIAGCRPRTSEILMHLEIYKAVPEARAVVHCHPPHATAYAITGRVPPTCVIPESEVFIGQVALVPYETPGTQKFAEGAGGCDLSEIAVRCDVPRDWIEAALPLQLMCAFSTIYAVNLNIRQILNVAGRPMLGLWLSGINTVLSLVALSLAAPLSRASRDSSTQIRPSR